jgi:hypothetical protein
MIGRAGGLVWWFTASGCVRVLALPTDSGPDDPVPVPESTSPPAEVCVPGETLGYALPSARWGLSALYASRRLDDRPDSALRLAPSFFLATGWELTGFGCATYGAPWVEVAPDDAGCLGLREETVWMELCRLYPLDYACDGYPGAFTGDTPEASALGLAWFALAAHALLGRYELDPDEWYATATDPLAVERLTAAMHYRSPWSGEVTDTIERCGDDVEACLGEDLLTYVSGVADKLEALEGATCHDAPLAPDDVRAFVGGLAAARPGRDWAAAESAALSALTGEGFATEAPAVLDAIDAAVPLTLACPEQELFTWYRLPCP